jgi:hypothetical protein
MVSCEFGVGGWGRPRERGNIRRGGRSAEERLHHVEILEVHLLDDDCWRVDACCGQSCPEEHP